MDQKKLIDQYSGAGASGYDQRREVTPRFQAEVRAFGELLGRVAPAWVVDCPVGTGRWFGEYAALGAEVFGIDYSQAMLAQAEQKRATLGERLHLSHGDIFDPANFRTRHGAGAGLVACIRFLNWVPTTRMREAFASLSQSPAEHMIVGVGVRPRDWSAARRLQARMSLWRGNLVDRAKGRPHPYVHAEEDVEETIAANGWTVRAREFIYEDAGRRNHFYLLGRDAGPPRTE